MAKHTIPTSMRLSEDGKALLQAIADSLGISKAAALEVIIREAAEKRTIKPPRRKSP